MAEKGKVESGTDFYFCSICRHSDFRGRKHVYSKKHKDRLKFVLQKFSAKVKGVEPLLASPEVIEGSFEKDASYWCIFCCHDVKRHIHDGRVTIKMASFIEHLCSEEHKQASVKYCRQHIADLGLIKQRLVFTDEDHEKFKTRLVQALDQFEKQSHSQLQKSAAAIRKLEEERSLVASSSDQPGHTHDVTTVARGQQEEQGQSQSRLGVSALDKAKHLTKVRTVAVISSGGLATIGSARQAGASGNVHTGATPPWLIDRSSKGGEEGGSSEGDRMAGPSEETFKKHLERQRKRKLNPDRVGANFDHTTPTNADWLPSFGRVWNSGRRWQSRHQYKQEKKAGSADQTPRTQSKPP